MNLSPEQMRQRMQQYADDIREAQRKEVAVGIPRGEATAKIYGDGTTVLQVAVAHEYALGRVPERSFLRVPFRVKRNEVQQALIDQFERVAAGRISVQQALGLVGATARNISVEAFTTMGYGQWPDIEQATKDAKGSTKPLIDTGTLRNSITWDVRDAT